MAIMPAGTTEEPLEYGIFFGDSLRKKIYPKIPVIDHFLYERDVICISAESGVGKSILALQILCNLTTGSPFLDTYAINKEYNVLLLQTEGDRAETLERLDSMATGMKINDDNWAHKQQCIRVSYAGSEDQVEQGIRIIAREARAAYESERTQARLCY